MYTEIQEVEGVKKRVVLGAAYKAPLMVKPLQEALCEMGFQKVFSGGMAESSYKHPKLRDLTLNLAYTPMGMKVKVGFTEGVMVMGAWAWLTSDKSLGEGLEVLMEMVREEATRD